MSGLRPFHLAVPVHYLVRARSFYGPNSEQATMFYTDPSGNALEIKAFGDDSQIFAS